MEQQQTQEQKIEIIIPSSLSSTNKKYILITISIVILCLICISIAFLFLKKDASLTASQQRVNATQSPAPTMQLSQQMTYSNPTLAAITGSPKNITSLPLGDNKYVTDAPKKGYIYLCNVQQGGGGAQESGSWIQKTTWNLTSKPSVQGRISWPNATFSNVISGANRIISGNDLPVNITTGTFPIQSSDPAYTYDRNPNTITAHSFSDTFPINPIYLQTPSCMGGEVGIMLNGVPLFNGFDAEHRDAAAHEIQDSCQGHPQEDGEYHYHSLSSCIPDIHETTVIGFALDGFPITGPVLSNGNYVTTSDLDECHGMTSSIILDGKETTTYHYVMTEDFPYSVSCFRGKPISLQVIASMNTRTSGSVQTQQLHPQPSGQTSVQQPPQAAFSACSGKTTGTSCTFTSPNGSMEGTCQLPPNQSTIVCAPQHSL